MRRIYLDHAATTPTDREILRLMQPYYSLEYSNPSSMHESGRRAARALREAREMVANCIGAYPHEIFFTGSGTESDNLAILGSARSNTDKGKHIIVSEIEHKAILEPAKLLEQEGFEVSRARVDRYGVVDINHLLKLIRKDTSLVSIMLVNNEIGTIEPIGEIAKSLKNKFGTNAPIFHTDACQAAGYIDIDVTGLGVDLMTINGSKIYGPKGVGVLYKRSGLKLSPLIIGGGQESGLRAGTESIPHIMGMALALVKANKLKEKERQRLAKIRDYLINGLRDKIDGVLINGDPQNRAPHIAHITIPKIEGESVVLMLDQSGIEASTGSACSSSDLRPSHVLTAIGQDNDLIHGSIRLSLGRDTSLQDINYLLFHLGRIVDTLRRTSFLTSKLYVEEKK